MKKHLLITLPFVLLVCLSFTGLKSGFIRLNQKNTGTVGDVKYSILSPEQFTMVNGDGWVLLDGAFLDVNSDLYKILQSTGHGNVIQHGRLPNADGVFIRSVDTNEADTYGDPEKNRIVGGYQADTFEKHDHAVKYYGGGGGYGSIVDGQRAQPHTVKTSVTGNDETRPKNICLFTYIKVNEGS